MLWYCAFYSEEKPKPSAPSLRKKLFAMTIVSTWRELTNHAMARFYWIFVGASNTRECRKMSKPFVCNTEKWLFSPKLFLFGKTQWIPKTMMSLILVLELKGKINFLFIFIHWAIRRTTVRPNTATEERNCMKLTNPQAHSHTLHIFYRRGYFFRCV